VAETRVSPSPGARWSNSFGPFQQGLWVTRHPSAGCSHHGNRSQLTLTGHPDAPRRGSASPSDTFTTNKLPMDAPEGLFIYIPTPPRKAYMCCQEKPPPQKTLCFPRLGCTPTGPSFSTNQQHPSLNRIQQLPTPVRP
jgi:hypothetical protein